MCNDQGLQSKEEERENLLDFMLDIYESDMKHSVKLLSECLDEWISLR